MTTDVASTVEAAHFLKILRFQVLFGDRFRLNLLHDGVLASPRFKAPTFILMEDQRTSQSFQNQVRHPDSSSSAFRGIRHICVI